MVVGGYHSGSAYLDSTEVYRDNEWKTVSGKLPRAISSMASASINEKIILFGIYHFMTGLFFICQTLGGYDGSPRNNILEYNPETETWQEVGTMKEARDGHAVTIVSLEDYAAWCE